MYKKLLKTTALLGLCAAFEVPAVMADLVAPPPIHKINEIPPAAWDHDNPLGASGKVYGWKASIEFAGVTWRVFATGRDLALFKPDATQVRPLSDPTNDHLRAEYTTGLGSKYPITVSAPVPPGKKCVVEHEKKLWQCT